MSSFYDANTYLQFSSSGAFNEKDDKDKDVVTTPYETAPIEDMLQRQKGQQASLQQNKILIDVPGNITLCIGDIVRFATVIKTTYNGVSSFVEDPYTSGNYLISDIQHKLDVIEGVLSSKFTLLKDCVSNPYKPETKIRIEGQRKELFLSIYSIDNQRKKESRRFYAKV